MPHLSERGEALFKSERQDTLPHVKGFESDSPPTSSSRRIGSPSTRSRAMRSAWNSTSARWTLSTFFPSTFTSQVA